MTNQFLKHASVFLVLGTISVFFRLFVSFVRNWHLSQKKPRRRSALLLPFHWRLPTSEREREREREREGERVGQKTQKGERFRDGKGEEGGRATEIRAQENICQKSEKKTNAQVT